MACLPLRVGSDATREFSIAPGVHVSSYCRMKQAFSRLYLRHVSCKGLSSPVWHARNMGSQSAAMEEMEAYESSESKFQRWQVDETNVLIAAKNRHDLENLEAIEAAGLNSKIVQNNWKKIETFCREKGVQRSSMQCQSRWGRITITYSQIKNWEQNPTPKLSYWSMERNERKANGFMLVKLDESTYNLLDQLYDGRGDLISDDSKGDVVEKVAECGNSEHMQPGQGLVEGAACQNSLSASVQESCESHRISSHFSSTQANILGQKQIEWIADNAASLRKGDTANSDLSSMVPMFPQEMQDGQVSGGAEPSEKMLEDQMHGEQVMGTAGSGRETLKGFRASPAFIEVNASNEHLSGQATETAASFPVIEKAGGTDSTTSLVDYLEAGDSTKVNNLSVLVEGAQEQQSRQVAGSAASFQDTLQSMNTGNQFSTTGVPDQSLQEAASEGQRQSSHFFSAEMNFIDGMSERDACSGVSMSTCEAVPLEERHQSQDTGSSTLVSSLGGEVLHKRQTEQVALATFAQEAREGHRTSSNLVSSRVEVLTEVQNKQVADSESSKSTFVPVSTTGGMQERTMENSHLLPSQECQGIGAVPVPNTPTSKTVPVKESQNANDEGSSKQQEIFEGKGTKTFGRPETEVKVVAVGDDKGSPATSEKGSGEGQGLQLYGGGKCDDDIVMYVPAAIGNAIKSVSQTIKKLFKF